MSEPEKKGRRATDATGIRGAFATLNDFSRDYPLPIYVFIFVVMAFSFWRVDQNADIAEDARVESRENFNEALGTIVAVQLQNCEDDHRFRRQYRVRGKAEKKLLILFLNLAAQNIAAGKPDSGVSTDFIEEFGPLSERIKIIPLPNCKLAGRRLRQQLGLVGAELPHFPTKKEP